MELKRNWMIEKVTMDKMKTLGDAFLSGVIPRLFNYITTHDRYSEGGRKMHITTAESELDSLALCGYFGAYSVTTEINKEWLEQPDPDNEVCLKCRRKAERLLNEV